jgi:hypothetical protein
MSYYSKLHRDELPQVYELYELCAIEYEELYKLDKLNYIRKP